MATVVIAPIAIVGLLAACGSTAREAEGEPDASISAAASGASDAAAAGADSAAPVICPERPMSGDDFIPRKVKFVNETDMTFRLSVATADWSCADYSGADNPSALNGLVVAPNPRSPLIVPVRARWNAPNLQVSIQQNNPGSDLPWTSVAKTVWGAGGFYGYAPLQPGTSRIGSYRLQDSNGADVGVLMFTACNHQGDVEYDTWNAIRFWPTDWQQCRDLSGVLDDGLPQTAN